MLAYQVFGNCDYGFANQVLRIATVIGQIKY